MEILNHAVDAAKIDGGVWVDYGDDGTQFLVGSPMSAKYKSLSREKFAELKRKVLQPKPDQIEKTANEIFSQAGILDWKGLTRDGKEFKYSYENALWLLENSPTIRDFLFACSNANALFYVERIEEAKKAVGES